MSFDSAASKNKRKNKIGGRNKNKTMKNNLQHTWNFSLSSLLFFSTSCLIEFFKKLTSGCWHKAHTFLTNLSFPYLSTAITHLPWLPCLHPYGNIHRRWWALILLRVYLQVHSLTDIAIQQQNLTIQPSFPPPFRTIMFYPSLKKLHTHGIQVNKPPICAICNLQFHSLWKVFSPLC